MRGALIFYFVLTISESYKSPAFGTPFRKGGIVQECDGFSLSQREYRILMRGGISLRYAENADYLRSELRLRQHKLQQ